MDREIDLGLRLTLLDLLLRPVGNWAVRPIILALALALLLRPAWLRHPLPWLALATLAGARVLLDWPLADNHAYLLAYWCLAAGLALAARAPAAVLELNGRLLIGLVFLFASLWKLALSGDYADGTFLQITFLTDPRFEGFARVAGGLSPETLEALRSQAELHRDGAPAPIAREVPIPDRLRLLAQAATVWNLGINAALALAYLWPGSGRRLEATRHGLLLVYCAVTYAVATVDGFGWLLLAMGAARCGERDRWPRYGYVAVFVLILLYREVPWAALMLGAL